MKVISKAMDMFSTTGRVDKFPLTDDINFINSTYIEIVMKLVRKDK